jgi:hypothetical protein
MSTVVDDRRLANRPLDPNVEDRRVAGAPRRKWARTKIYKGAQIVWGGGGPIRCIVRNLSEGGACLEVHNPIPNDSFDLIFDTDQARYSCSVVWRQAPKMGVRFL